MEQCSDFTPWETSPENERNRVHLHTENNKYTYHSYLKKIFHYIKDILCEAPYWIDLSVRFKLLPTSDFERCLNMEGLLKYIYVSVVSVIQSSNSLLIITLFSV